MTATPLRIAALGFWHLHAKDYAGEAARREDTELVGIWDDDAERGAAASETFGVPWTDDLDALLARDDIDGVTITCATTQHHDVISRALAAGKHVFSEKLLAPTTAESQELVDRAAGAGLALEVSLPRLYEGTTVAVKRLIAEEAFGDLLYTRVRLAHDGWVTNWLPERFGDPAEAIGGALTDLGCHPVYLTRLFHGRAPDRLVASYGSSSGRQVEDHAVVTMEFAGGALGVAEASLAQTPGTFTLELRGTTGSALFGFGGRHLLVQRAGGSRGEEWVEEVVPEAEPGAMDRWIDAIRTGVTDTENLDAAVELTRLVEASNSSAARRAAVAL